MSEAPANNGEELHSVIDGINRKWNETRFGEEEKSQSLHTTLSLLAHLAKNHDFQTTLDAQDLTANEGLIMVTEQPNSDEDEINTQQSSDTVRYHNQLAVDDESNKIIACTAFDASEFHSKTSALCIKAIILLPKLSIDQRPGSIVKSPDAASPHAT